MSLFSEIFKTRRYKSKLDYIRDEIHRSSRFGYNFGIIVIDVNISSTQNIMNKFSGYKPKLDILKDYLRPYDRMINENNSRYYIILPQTDGIGCKIVKDRIYNLYEKYNLASLSLGISIYPQDGTNASRLLNTAVERLKDYKENGNNGRTYKENKKLYS